MTLQPQLPQQDDARAERPKKNSKHEVARLQSEITDEIERDAPHIARMVFGETKDMPDMVGLPNEHIDQVYRQKFLAEDRAWLQGEARRDPEQFLKVAERIGVQVPPAPMGVPTPAPVAGAFAKAAATGATASSGMAPSMPPVAAPPVPVPPAPVLLPSSPPVPAGAQPPIILGPNGQPLPPSGVV